MPAEHGIYCRFVCSLEKVARGFALGYPQLYADNLKCNSVCRRALFSAARFTVRYVRAVGQDVSRGKCVLLRTSTKAVRKSLKSWDVSGDGRPWSVELDVRDLGGHWDFTRWTRAGTLSRRVREATYGVAAVGALPVGFQAKLGLVRGISCWLGCMLLERRVSPLLFLVPFVPLLLRLSVLGRCPLLILP